MILWSLVLYSRQETPLNEIPLESLGTIASKICWYTRNRTVSVIFGSLYLFCWNYGAMLYICLIWMIDFPPGHTLVPQLSGPLGVWVRQQRENYRRWKADESSPMNAEKALQLTEIGFYFEAERFKGRNNHLRDTAWFTLATFWECDMACMIRHRAVPSRMLNCTFTLFVTIHCLQNLASKK